MVMMITVIVMRHTLTLMMVMTSLNMLLLAIKCLGTMNDVTAVTIAENGDKIRDKRDCRAIKGG